MSLWRDRNGWTVETIRLSMTGRRHADGDWYLVKQPRHGGVPAVMGRVRTPAEIERLGVDLASLEQQ